MSMKDTPPEIVEIFSKITEQMGGGSFHFTPIRVCDHCQDDDKEAFPYCVRDRNGREWEDLCNGCFDFLGCVVEFDDDWIEVDIDDLKRWGTS